MPESRWKGYIKDYNGSTMMQCKIHGDTQYSTVYEDIRKQRDALMECILKVV